MLPNLIVPRLDLPIIHAGGSATNISVHLPDLDLPNVLHLDVSRLTPELIRRFGDEDLLLINLPGITIVLPDLPVVGGLGAGVLGVVLDQVSSVSQALSNTANQALLSPVQQILDNLTGGGSPAASSDGPSGSSSAGGASGMAALPLSNLWMWNAVTFGTSGHSGYQFRAGSGDNVITGTTLEMRTNERSEMPGLLWDASTLVGLRPGTLHFGVNGGIAESDLDVRANSALRSLGLTQAGVGNLKSWSAGGFALLTTRAWYTGAAAGGSWGRAETENFVTGARSNYDGTSFTSALFAGTILPIVSDDVRLDLRATLGYQRTVGEAHNDTIGITYSDHIVETFDGSLSARLFGVVRLPSFTLRPYVQSGVVHRFHYLNELQIQGIDFSFDDADTSVFFAGGLDFDINSTLQLSAGIRHDHSPDYDSLAGRIGVLLKLN
ncbi:MAG: autotransporter outer membrane beta-barrel domain-containing protein [Sphingomonadales bacterium]|nr:autotransporter outer membrane beta-barrel domain-containing protein [Sphingomonadales bacterium]